MRATEKLVLLVALAVPVAVAIAGWQLFSRWSTAPQAVAPESTPTAVAVAAQPTLGPTLPPATVQARPATPNPGATATASRAEPTRADASTATQAERAQAVSADAPQTTDPSAAVASFYDLVSSHQFDAAAQLWSPRMRASFPPSTNLNQRFSQTTDIRLQRLDVVKQDPSQATVAVDLVESDGPSGSRHFVGNWLLVRGSSGWLLDQPELQLVP